MFGQKEIEAKFQELIIRLDELNNRDKDLAILLGKVLDQQQIQVQQLHAIAQVLTHIDKGIDLLGMVVNPEAYNIPPEQDPLVKRLLNLDMIGRQIVQEDLPKQPKKRVPKIIEEPPKAEEPEKTEKELEEERIRKELLAKPEDNTSQESQ